MVVAEDAFHLGKGVGIGSAVLSPKIKCSFLNLLKSSAMTKRKSVIELLIE